MLFWQIFSHAGQELCGVLVDLRGCPCEYGKKHVAGPAAGELRPPPRRGLPSQTARRGHGQLQRQFKNLGLPAKADRLQDGLGERKRNPLCHH